MSTTYSHGFEMVKEIHELDQKVYYFSIFPIHSNAPVPTHFFPLMVLMSLTDNDNVALGNVDCSPLGCQNIMKY